VVPGSEGPSNPWTLPQLLACNFQLIVDLLDAGNLLRLRNDFRLLGVVVDRTAQRHHAAGGDDLHVVGVGREAVIGDDRLPDLLGDVEVRLVLRLVARRERIAAAVADVLSGIVGRVVLRPRQRRGEQRERKRSYKQYALHESSFLVRVDAETVCYRAEQDAGRHRMAPMVPRVIRCNTHPYNWLDKSLLRTLQTR